MFIPMWMVLNSDHTSFLQDLSDLRDILQTAGRKSHGSFFFLLFLNRTKGFVEWSEYKASSQHHGRR